jgi:putative hemolysin
MAPALLEITIILLLVLTNGLLSGSEIAVVTSRKAKLRHRAGEGDVAAGRALELANAPNRFLSTVQIGITTVAVVAGAFGGVRLAEPLAPLLARLGLPAALAAQAAFVLVVIAITYLTLVVGELVPKRIALNDPERVAARVAATMQRLSVLAAPLVRLLGHSTDLVLRLVPLRAVDEPEVTEEEIRGLIANAAATGVIEPTEQQIVERLFRLSDRTLGMLMTPRTAIVWLDRAAGPDAWRRRLGEVRHTRYLVADGDLDHQVGYVKVQDLLEQALRGEPLALEPLLREPHVLPARTPVFRLLELFRWSGAHIAVVTGEGGRVEGIVTLNDVLEGLVGGMPEWREIVAPGVVEREDGSWLVDGLLAFERFADFFGRQDPRAPEFATLHDFVLERLGGRPATAAVVRWRGLRLEIVDMDGAQIDKVLVMVEADGAAG